MVVRETLTKQLDAELRASGCRAMMTRQETAHAIRVCRQHTYTMESRGDLCRLGKSGHALFSRYSVAEFLAGG